MCTSLTSLNDCPNYPVIAGAAIDSAGEMRHRADAGTTIHLSLSDERTGVCARH